MGVPSTRTPVRVARGTYANLSTVNALAALQEGEICFATDQDKLYVKEGAGLTGISASSQSNPTPADVTASPAFASGTGTQADPYVITGGAVPFAGGSLESAQEITIESGVGGDLVVFTDNSVAASGERFAAQPVGTINSAGKYTFKFNYEDVPNTGTNNTTYNGLLQVGTTHFSWTVVQSNLSQLSQATATTVAGTLGSGSVLTATEGTVSGGTSPYTYATRWQRSLNGTSGWFDINATGTTYTQTANDAGFYLRAVTTATDSTSGAAGGPLTFELESASTAQIPITAAPVINSVALSEDNTGGSRFTSESFTVAATMVNDGTPVSSKALKGTVTANFAQYPATDSVSSNSSSTSSTPTLSDVRTSGDQYNPYSVTKQYDSTLGQVSIISGVVQSSNWYMYKSTDGGSNWSNGEYIQNLSYVQGLIRDQGFIISNRAATPTVWKEGGFGNNSANYRQLNKGDFGDCVGTDGNHMYGLGSSHKGFVRAPIANGLPNTSAIEYAQSNAIYEMQSYNPMTAVGNGKIVSIFRSGNNYNYYNRAFVLNISNWSSTATYDSTYTWTNETSTAYWLRFMNGYFYAGLNGGVYRSSDGASWTALSAPFGGYFYNSAIWDFENGYLFAWCWDSNTSTWHVVKSNNNGSTWTKASGGVANTQSSEVLNVIPAFGHYFVGNYGGSAISYYPRLRRATFLTQSSITLNSTNGLSSFNVGDSVRKEGQSDIFYYGIITSINTSTGVIGVQSSYEFQAGDVIEGLASTGSASSSKYIVMNAQGDVSALTSTDPGFVSFGPGTSHSITFPATLSTGGAPDTELPSGTSLQVTVRATNSVGTDDYISNSVTPA